MMPPPSLRSFPFALVATPWGGGGGGGGGGGAAGARLMTLHDLYISPRLGGRMMILKWCSGGPSTNLSRGIKDLTPLGRSLP